MLRHPEQEAIDLPCHEAAVIVTDLRRDINGFGDIPAGIW
jgi:hypothetical protein